jgi:hypothetical protein
MARKIAFAFWGRKKVNWSLKYKIIPIATDEFSNKFYWNATRLNPLSPAIDPQR